MRLGDEKVSDMCFMVLTVVHLAETLLFSHPMPVGIGYWFYGFFHTLCLFAYGDTIMSLRYSGENSYG